MTVGFSIDGSAPVTPRDAATVLVLREGDGAPEVFFVRRNAGASFMGGAYVFPGGRLDEADADPDVPCDLDADEAARRLREDDPARARGLHVAALRECLEESGILLATAPVADDVVAALRHALEGRSPTPVGPPLRAAGVTLATSALVPFARWVTPKLESRRFDARFFVARAPGRSHHATHDGSETVASAWLSPRAAIERAQRREIALAPPTWRTLEGLLDARTVDDVIALAPASLTPIEPTVILDGDTPCVVMPESGELAMRYRYDNGYWVPGR
jgi:8-oxo-dGTP pyrophosphatase MutT (NUDIX family)